MNAHIVHKLKNVPQPHSQTSMTQTVKAREHHGANSLDLTLPVEVVREYNVTPGDVFEIEFTEEDGDVVLQYRRVYES